MFHESAELFGWRASDGEWGGQAGRMERGQGSCQAGGSLDEQVESACEAGRGGTLSLPAGPGGEAFELLARGEEEGLG